MVGTKPIRSPSARHFETACRSSRSVEVVIKDERSGAVEPLERLRRALRHARVLEALLRRGERTAPDVGRVSRDRFARGAPELGVAPHEARRDPLLDAEEIVPDEDLTVAERARADADG